MENEWLTIDRLKDDDWEWVEPLFAANKNILGSVSMMRWRWCAKPYDLREPILVIRPYAFAHFHKKKNGEVTLYEIAVDPSMKRKGLGKRLMEKMGYPMTLKTDADNEESNAFYKALGFICMGSKETKSGKPVNIYTRFA